MINEATLFVSKTKKFIDDIKNLPDNWNISFLEEVVERLKERGLKGWNKEYKLHLIGRKGKGCSDIHIPDPDAYLPGYEYSDWVLIFKIDGKTLTLLETGSHKHLFEKSSETNNSNESLSIQLLTLVNNLY